jgi:hypothetical protein
MYISLENAKRLANLGCNINAEEFGFRNMWYTGQGDLIDALLVDTPTYIECKTYNLLYIISNKELARAFFGDNDSTSLVVDFIEFLLEHDKKEEAEEYLLEHCVWSLIK